MHSSEADDLASVMTQFFLFLFIIQQNDRIVIYAIIKFFVSYRSDPPPPLRFYCLEILWSIAIYLLSYISLF